MDSSSSVTATGLTDTTKTNSLYRELDRNRLEIRLLVVEPGSEDDNIDCTFEYTFLADQNPRAYETVSYVWGDPKIRSSILLHGEPADVPASSKTVLRRMRLRNQRRDLWIDAVCINQNDIEERSSQVAMMNEIYSKTTQNLIWLGEDANDTNNAAHQVITTILEDMKRETNDFETLGETLYGPPPESHFKVSTSATSINVDWAPFIDYFANTWFERLWVVQEAVLPKESICIRGSLEIPLKDVLKAAVWVKHKAISLDGVEGASKLQSVLSSPTFIFMYGNQYGRYSYSMSRIKDWYMSLALLLNDLGGYKALDPKDHVYGVLGIYGKFMGSTRFPRALIPDYKLLCREVFRGVAKYILKREVRLDSLEDIRQYSDESDAPDFPSWVTRWHHNPDSNPAPLDFSAGEAVKLDTTFLDSSNEPSVLSLKGVPVGSIMETGPVMSRKEFSEDRGRHLKSILKKASELVGSGDIQALVSQHDKVAATLIGNTDGYRSRLSNTESAELFDQFLAYTVERKYYPPRLDSPITVKDPQAAKASSYWQGLKRACVERRLFSTDLDHLGVGPSRMMPGDVLVVLFGGECPFVLRPVETEVDRYELIGPCWAYAIMDGEATDAWIASGQPSSNFHLV